MSGKHLVTIGNRDGVACRREVGSEVPLLVIHVFNLRPSVASYNLGQGSASREVHHCLTVCRTVPDMK